MHALNSNFIALAFRPFGGLLEFYVVFACAHNLQFYTLDNQIYSAHNNNYVYVYVWVPMPTSPPPSTLCYT